MRRHQKQAWIALLSLLVLASCTPSYKEMFLNRTYRENLSLQDEELKTLQFYISTNVLVQYESPSGKQSLLLPEETPGVVTAVGPDWLKVSFREGGAEVPDTGEEPVGEAIGGFAGLVADLVAIVVDVDVRGRPGRRRAGGTAPVPDGGIGLRRGH